MCGMEWYGIDVYERRAKPGVREKSKVDWIGEGRKRKRGEQGGRYTST